MADHNPIDHPAHYTQHPSGVECIDVTEHMGFNLGNAIKYIWRADLKGAALQDLEKAAWYIQRELGRRRFEAEQAEHRAAMRAELVDQFVKPASPRPAYCGEGNPDNGGGVCTRPAGHTGDHWAQTEPGAMPFARWAQERRT